MVPKTCFVAHISPESGFRVGLTRATQGPILSLLWPKTSHLHIICHPKCIGPPGHGSPRALAPPRVILCHFWFILGPTGPVRASFSRKVATNGSLLRFSGPNVGLMVLRRAIYHPRFVGYLDLHTGNINPPWTCQLLLVPCCEKWESTQTLPRLCQPNC